MVNGGKINRGSCVYVNGVSLSVITTLLVIVRRNGFRPARISTGDTVKHRGTTVMMDKLGLIIKGGKPVHVLNPDSENTPAQRYTVENGETKYVNPLQWLVGGSMRRINSSVEFMELWCDNEGKPQYKDDGEIWVTTVVKRGSNKPIGHYEFD